MVCKVDSKLDVKLYQAVHGYCYAESFNDHDLEISARGKLPWKEIITYPNVCEGRTDRFFAIPSKSLGYKGYHSHENPYEAVLEDA